MLAKREIERLFKLLNDELAKTNQTGELYLVGGAVMCLVYDARASTKDVDALFKPAGAIREAARRVALQAHVADDWLNDAVKGYLSERGDFRRYADLSNLRVMVAAPEYLLAMKCLAMRLGAEFHDEADIRFLLRLLDIARYDDALALISRYYPLNKFPQKTLYALEEMVAR
ncbi:MAG: DUF6036 family nucleotidyltransferase [Proteobacteria bacterium]|nr:DUF6036 family nucleotidyltransferase [Pseudomonadota bacterium]